MTTEVKFIEGILQNRRLAHSLFWLSTLVIFPIFGMSFMKEYKRTNEGRRIANHGPASKAVVAERMREFHAKDPQNNKRKGKLKRARFFLRAAGMRFDLQTKTWA